MSAWASAPLGVRYGSERVRIAPPDDESEYCHGNPPSLAHEIYRAGIKNREVSARRVAKSDAGSPHFQLVQMQVKVLNHFRQTANFLRRGRVRRFSAGEHQPG